MIPRKIQIKNFLSYGSPVQTIEFTKHKLICLSGKNGHGKSALLDAITWVVWGQARKIGATAKPDQGLLRLGEVEMTVIFDFEFNHQLYRVKRDFSQKYGKPHAHVEFGLLKDQDYYVSLSEKTIRKTQEIIEQTIGLDFDTFVNSCFLRQGGANEFSKKSAKERKEVLSTILGLSRYEKARTVALEQSRTVATEITHLEKLQEHNNQEFELLKTVPEQQKELTKQLEHITKKQQEQLQQELELKKQLQALQEQQQKKAIVETNFQQNQKQKQEQTAQFSQLVQQWKQTHQLIIALPNKELLEQQLQTITQECTQLQKQFEDTLKNKELLLTHKEQLQKAVAEQSNKAQKQTEQYKLTIERLKTEVNQQEKILKLVTQEQKEAEQKQEQLQKQLLALQSKIVPDYLLSGYQEQAIIFERHKGHYQRWVQQGNWITAQLAELNQKQCLSQDPNDPSCPLCEQNLSQARKRFLQKKFQDQQLILQHKLHRITIQIKNLKAFLHTQHTQLLQLKELEQLRTQQEQLETTTKTLTIKKQEQEQLVTTTQKLLQEKEQEQKVLQEQLQKEEQESSVLQELKSSIHKLEAELLTNSFKPEMYQKIQKQKIDLEEQLKNCQQLPIYQAAQKERFNTVHQLKKSLNSLQAQEEKFQKALQAFCELPTQQEIAQKNLEQLNGATQEQNNKKEQLLQQKGTLEAQAQKLQILKKQQQEYSHKIQEYKTQLFDLQQISIALGKDGIQALLIEDAIPEIEQEANDLLARLTDNQAQISIESLRDLKKGGTRETLDINISDAQGIRPYELFSGGEAFRIDFALRIAISKLLARRAGTSLQTLIIDEGFGSQDDEGLTRMMDALYTIQDDFEKIIIVSHLQSMKEQFPVHFYIQKTPNGSTVTIIEH